MGEDGGDPFSAGAGFADIEAGVAGGVEAFGGVVLEDAGDDEPAVLCEGFFADHGEGGSEDVGEEVGVDEVEFLGWFPF